MNLFSALAILHRSPKGSLVVTSQHGVPSAIAGLGRNRRDSSGQCRRPMAASRWLASSGVARHDELALAAGSPTVPGGYVVYGEVPLPAGTVLPSGFPGLQYAVYNGPTQSSPVLFATTKTLPLDGRPGAPVAGPEQFGRPVYAEGRGRRRAVRRQLHWLRRWHIVGSAAVDPLGRLDPGWATRRLRSRDDLPRERIRRSVSSMSSKRRTRSWTRP